VYQRNAGQEGEETGGTRGGHGYLRDDEDDGGVASPNSTMRADEGQSLIRKT
jgi:hypothetical protein